MSTAQDRLDVIQNNYTDALQNEPNDLAQAQSAADVTAIQANVASARSTYYGAVAQQPSRTMRAGLKQPSTMQRQPWRRCSRPVTAAAQIPDSPRHLEQCNSKGDRTITGSQGLTKALRIVCSAE